MDGYSMSNTLDWLTNLIKVEFVKTSDVENGDSI